MSCNKQPALQCNYDITLQTRTRSSVKPPKSVWPSADHAIDTHSGSLTLLVSERSGLSSSTIDLKISQSGLLVGYHNRVQTYLLSRSKIFMQLWVAAHSQYRFGEKTRALTTSPASSEYRCLASLRSQSMVIPSFPPEAAKEPSGETEMVLM